jgi:hypothetical protein
MTLPSKAAWLLLAIIIPTISAWTPPLSSSRLAIRQTPLGAAASTKSWFPIHPADALSSNNDYDGIVKSAYLRHVLVDTEQMADLILEIYVGGGRLEREDASGFVWDDDRARGKI